MAMRLSGTVQGAAARKYAGFTYLKPVLARVDIWQLDPDRLYPTHVYPRFPRPPSQPNTKIVELADYMVDVGDERINGMSTVQVWMMPNEYPEKKKPLFAYELAVAIALTRSNAHIDEALTRVFGGSHATPAWVRW